MEFSVSQDLLSRGLSVVNRFVNPRSTLPVLSNILISAGKGGVKLSATNLETGINYWIKCDVRKEGAITLPARTLVDMIGSFSAGEIVFTADEKNQTATINFLSSTHEIKGIGAEDFPPVPSPILKDGIDINLDNFKSSIQQVAFSASTEDARPTLNSIKVEVSGRKLTLTATDGYRLSIREEILLDPVNKDINILVPVKTMIELARINPNGKALTMVVADSKNQVIFHMDGVDLVSQLIEGKYPGIRNIIPTGFKTQTTISTKDFLKACQQARVIARAGNHSAVLRIEAGQNNGEGSIEIQANADATGNSDVTFPVSVEGNPIQISFDVRFLIEVLEVVKSEHIYLETNVSNSAAVIRPVEDEGYIHVIMPRAA